MTEPVEAVTHYLWAELWQFENGGSGFHVRDANGDQVDREAASSLALDMGECLLAPPEGKVFLSVFMTSGGSISTRRDKTIDLSRREHFVWARQNLYRSLFVTNGERMTEPRLMKFIWRLEWRWHQLRGRLKAPQTTPVGAATPVAPSLTDLVSEQSEASQPSSQGAGGTVVKFPQRYRRDDSSSV